MPAPDRRAFLAASALAFLDDLPAARAAEARVVRLDADAEPLVRLIEDTPRPRLLEEIGARVKAGLPYRDVLAALFLEPEHLITRSCRRPPNTTPPHTLTLPALS